jgi:hypothetical protein
MIPWSAVSPLHVGVRDVAGAHVLALKVSPSDAPREARKDVVWPGSVDVERWAPGMARISVVIPSVILCK